MRVRIVNEGTLRKPQGPCYPFAIFSPLKEVHLFPLKSHRVTVNSEYFKSNTKTCRINAVSKSDQTSLVLLLLKYEQMHSQVWTGTFYQGRFHLLLFVFTHLQCFYKKPRKNLNMKLFWLFFQRSGTVLHVMLW